VTDHLDDLIDPKHAEELIAFALKIHRELQTFPGKTAKLQALRAIKHFIQLGFAYHKQKGLDLSAEHEAEALEIYKQLDAEVAKAKAMPSRRKKSSAHRTRTKPRNR
jgi:hypothetical protein